MGRLPRLPAHLRPRRERHPHASRTTATSPTSTSLGCAREGAIYVELIASPDHAANVGLTDAEHYGGIAAGIDDARRETGIEARILIAAIRNFGVEAAVDIARRHAEERHPYIVGFNLAGDEAGYPPAQFREAYEIAAASGLGCTVHAGEHAGAESRCARRSRCPSAASRTAFARSRIRALVEEIAERGIVLEVCPTSNIATHVYASLRGAPTPQTP